MKSETNTQRKEEVWVWKEKLKLLYPTKEEVLGMRDEK